MVIACWSPKGGTGTTVVAVALALALAAEAEAGASVLLADLDGDVPALLGLPDPGGPGLADWLAADSDVPGDALARLEVDAGAGLRLLPAGPGLAASAIAATPPGRGAALAGALSADSRTVVADCGLARSGAGMAVAEAAAHSILVLRPCYLALQRALAVPRRPTGVVLVSEATRSLGPGDVEEVVRAPILAVVRHEPAVARAVDAGLLARRLPRQLGTAARRAIDAVGGAASPAHGEPADR